MDGTPVKCISIAFQIENRSAYKPRDKDLHDLKLLPISFPRMIAFEKCANVTFVMLFRQKKSRRTEVGSRHAVYEIEFH